MITVRQAGDLGVYALARSVRFALGWYWTPSQKATLVKAEDTARQAYRQHARGA
jgi:hypothetical protein